MPEDGMMTADPEATYRADQAQAQAPITTAIRELNRYCIGDS
jgi:hypothetical protein